MLQEAIKLLQLSRLELSQTLHQYALENPVLEEETEATWEEQAGDRAEELEPGSSENGDSGNLVSDGLDWDWERYLEDASDSYLAVAREDKETPSFENFLSRPISLIDHLQFQLYTSTTDQALQEIGNYIIGNLDQNGYLRVPIAEISAELGVSIEAVERALRLVQSFDPPGIGARDLKECLLLQLKERGEEKSLDARILSECAAELEAGKWKLIAERLRVDLGAVMEAIERIRKLDPRPARSFTAEETQYLTPDVFIYKIEGEYVVVLNDEGLPRLRISPYYLKILRKGGKEWDGGTREYIEEKMRQAVWLLRSVGQRQRTLYKVAQSLVKFQRRFLDEGISYLRPLTLRQVAEDISVHESTVSRVTANKYVHTPQGTFEMKFFFHRGLSSQGGDMVSSTSVREEIRKILSGEEGGRPLSDQRLCQILRSRGIKIARRTVAKYRAQLQIPSSTRRKGTTAEKSQSIRGKER